MAKLLHRWLETEAKRCAIKRRLIEVAQGTGARRIVSLVPSLTELLFSLELGDDLVGRTSFCIHPADDVARVAKVGGTKTPRIDKIKALAPTHVVVNVDENRREDVELLTQYGVEAIVTHPLRVDDNLELFQLLGRVFDREPQAARLRDAFLLEREKLPSVGQAVDARKVLYLIWYDPWMTVSRDTYIASMLSLLRWRTVAHDPNNRYPALSASQIIESQPELILLSSEPFPFKAKHHALLEHMFEQAGREAPPIVDVDGEMMSWYGSRAILALAYLAQLGRTWA